MQYAVLGQRGPPDLEILCSRPGANAVAGISVFVLEYPAQNGRVGNYEGACSLPYL